MNIHSTQQHTSGHGARRASDHPRRGPWAGRRLLGLTLATFVALPMVSACGATPDRASMAPNPTDTANHGRVLEHSRSDEADENEADENDRGDRAGRHSTWRRGASENEADENDTGDRAGRHSTWRRGASENEADENEADENDTGD